MGPAELGAARRMAEVILYIHMAFKLHGAPPFACTRVVDLIAKESNIPCETLTIDFQAAGG